MKFADPIYITRPFMAPLETFSETLVSVWDSQWFTNNGPRVRELEKKLATKLNTNPPLLVTNGTVALHLAIRTLELQQGTILTTPFTWIATSSSILWEGYTAKLVDIDPNTFNIDVSKIEDSITEDTVAIMAVHVFSNPCDVIELERISKQYNLPIIYDAAHAFGVRVAGKSIFSWGDISTASFHATKVFNTAEGGGVFCSTPERYEVAYSIRDFGFDRERNIERLGTNAKMSEIHAALGLANLPLIEGAVEKRRTLTETYRTILGERVGFQQYDPDAYNYAYMPVIFKTESELLRVVEHLNAHNVFPRRYFHPSLSEMTVLLPDQPCPVAEDLASRILCLPLYPTLEIEAVEQIAKLILQALA